MKKAKSGKGGSATKRGRTPKNLEEYSATVPKRARDVLIKMREVIRSAVPSDATETISYGIPAFKHKEILVWFAAFDKHCSLFPKASVIEAFKNELKAYTTSKGTIQFPIEKPLPIAFIKKIVKARVAQVEGK